MMSKYLFALAVVGACVLVLSCNGDASGPDDSSFTVTITGDTTFSFEGEALFGVSTTNGRDHWVLLFTRGLFGGLDFDAVAIGRNESATPIGVGVHTIEDATSDAPDGEDIEGIYTLARSSDGSIASYGSVLGSLTISSATADRIQGEFSFSAEFVLAVGPSFRDVRNVTIAGSFAAVPGTIPSIN
jgi:hypothetical protein